MEDVLNSPPPGRLLLSVLVKAVILVGFLLYGCGVGVSYRILYSIDSYLHVSCSGSITSVGEERANLSAIVNL